MAKFYKRVWLNAERQMSNAFVLGWIDADDDEPMLKIGDCDRVLSFWLRRRDPAEKRNSLRKLDRLVKTLNEFRLALYAEWGVTPREL